MKFDKKTGLLKPESNAKKLAWCFGVPFLTMIVIYCALQTWPVGEHSVLVLDLNAQYVFYFEQLRDCLVEGESIIYSFERALGGEFMGIYAYYLSSPLSLLVALFPKVAITEFLYFILVLKCGLCGLSFGYYLTKTKKLSTPVTVAVSSMYALSSFAVVMQHNLMWTDNIIAFPLLLLAVDAVIKHGKFKMYIIVLCWCILSNFYIGYMSCLFVLFWFFIRYFMLSPEERNPMDDRKHFWKSLGRVAGYSAVAVMISAIIILPIYYSLSFGKLEFSDPKYEAKAMYDFLDILTKTFIGSYDTVRPAGIPFIYCSTAAMILFPLYFFIKSIPTRKKVGNAVIISLLVASFNFSLLDFLWHGFQRPNWLNARFTFMLVGIVLSMVADVFMHIREVEYKWIAASGVIGALLLLLIDKLEYEHIYEFTVVWLGLLFIIVTLGYLLTYAKTVDKEKTNRTVSAVMAVLIVFELCANGVIMLYRLDEDVVISTRASYRDKFDPYIEAMDYIYERDDTFFRTEKLYNRSKNDNFALDMRGLSNSTSTLNARIVKLLGNYGYSSMSHWSMYSGGTAPTDALFGLKYIIADEKERRPVMSYIYDNYDKILTTEAGLDIYENPYALSVMFSADEEILGYDIPVAEGEPEKEYVNPFVYMNRTYSALLGRDVEIWHEVDATKAKYTDCKKVSTAGHDGYRPQNDDGRVSWTLTIESDMPVYFYFPTVYRRDANVEIDGTYFDKYFDTKYHCIREMGSYEAGEQVDFALIPKKDVMYIRKNQNFFYYFDEEAYLEAVTELKMGDGVVYSEVDHKLSGTVTVPDGMEVIMTTIPYDEGWVITVDGEEAGYRSAIDGSLIAIEAAPGTHEVTMEYKPACITNGAIISITGVWIFAVMWVLDRYMNKKQKPKKLSREDIKYIVGGGKEI